ncbi:hypothetical protein H8D83_00490, partial [Candidatus Woesearchaeota archaeon]|nr:hypothetical protein [Candidatus Woesearchaeota archaeon]
GTTINHPVNLGDPTNFLNVFEESATCPESGQTYQKCGSSNIYHNNKTNSIIFSKESLSFQEPDQNIFSYFDNLFEFIFNWEPKYGFDLTYNFIEDTKDFNKLYVSNQQQIIAITENVWPSSGKEHITVKYSGIGADVCDSIEAYDSSIGEADYLQCTENSGSHYVVSGLPEGVNMWPKLTSKLRPKS